MLFTYEKYWLIKQLNMIDDIKNNIILLCKIKIFKAPTYKELCNPLSRELNNLNINGIIFDTVYDINIVDFGECKKVNIYIQDKKNISHYLLLWWI